MVMKILKSLIAGCDLGKKGNVCLANQAILELMRFFLAKVRVFFSNELEISKSGPLFTQ